MIDVEFNRLRWRCQRGMLELDHILGRFLERDYAGATPEVRQAFKSLLEMEDADILDLVLGNVVPAPDLQLLIDLLRRSRGV